MDNLVWGYWDCPVCGKKEIRGDITSCPSCGRARGDVEFYLKGYTEGQVLSAEEHAALETEELNEEEARHYGKNPDWYCPFCNSLNHDSLQVCGTCGASRKDADGNYFDQLNKRKEKEAAELAAQPHPEAAKKKRPAWLIPVILAVIALLVYLFWPKTIKGQVTSVSWTRNIRIEEYQKEIASGWTAPAGAKVVETKMEPRTYYRTVYVDVQYPREVFDHYETEITMVSNGDGTYSPVTTQREVTRTEYDTVQEPQTVPYFVNERKYYYYTGKWIWVYVRDEAASRDDQSPYWPEAELGENEREGARTEEYRFTAADENGRQTTYRIVKSDHAESDWMKLPVGTKVKITGNKTVTDMDGNKIADVEKVK